MSRKNSKQSNFSEKDKFMEVIEKRLEFVSQTGLFHTRSLELFSSLEDIIKYGDKGIVTAYLVISGCYPDRDQYNRFLYELQVAGSIPGCKSLIWKLSRNSMDLHFMLNVQLTVSRHKNLIDVTHTKNAPYLTGIQRVVGEIAAASSDVVVFSWEYGCGIIQEANLNRNEATINGSEIKFTWQRALIARLHGVVPYLERRYLTNKFKKLMLPLAKKVKRKLLNNEITNHKQSTSGLVLNLFVIDNVITLIEIPEKINQISYYEILIESNSLTFQVVLHDFIPFFHAWTVHPSNRGHLNSYVRLVLIADRVVAVSRLIAEQAELVIKAFRLERTNWESRPYLVEYSTLPPGLHRDSADNFVKISNQIVMLGSLEPRKNHLQFLAALEILFNKGILFDALIIGSTGWENEHLLEKIFQLKSKGLSVERISGAKDAEVKTLIGTSRVLVQISEAEGFGLPVAEALELGTEVIVSSVRPLRDMNSKYIHVVPLGDAIELAAKIHELIETPHPRIDNVDIGPKWNDWANLLFKT
jgi:glycosyltransferase involved in cell wall biosynthesis